MNLIRKNYLCAEKQSRKKSNDETIYNLLEDFPVSSSRRTKKFTVPNGAFLRVNVFSLLPTRTKLCSQVHALCSNLINQNLLRQIGTIRIAIKSVKTLAMSLQI